MARDFLGGGGSPPQFDRLDYAQALALGADVAHWGSLWVYFDALAHTSYLFTAHQSGDAALLSAFYVTTSGTVGYQLVGSLASMSRVTTTTISTGAWTQLMFWCNGSGTGATGIRIWISGVEASYGAATNAGGTYNPGGKWSLGGRIYDDTRNVDGRLANAGIGAGLPSAAEIAAAAARCSPWAFTGVVWAPSLAADSINDPVTGQAGSADGTADAAHPNTYFPGAFRRELLLRGAA